MLEILDEIISGALGVHFLEPLTSFKDVYKARQLVKNAARSPIGKKQEATVPRYM